MFVRDRVDRLLDPGSPFLEIGQLAGHELYDDWLPAGGVVAGIGQRRAASSASSSPTTRR